MFGYIAVVLTVFQITAFTPLFATTTRSQMFAIRIEGYRFADHIEIQEVPCLSFVTGLAACSMNTDCKGVSFKSTELLCRIAIGELNSRPDLMSNLVSRVAWTTMFKWDYTVYLTESPLGRYKMTFSGAATLCANAQTSLASPSDLMVSKRRGLDMCRCGWMSDGNRGYVVQMPSYGCDYNPDWVTICNHFVTADAWCLA